MGGRGGQSGMGRPRNTTTKQQGSQVSQQTPNSSNVPLNPNALNDISNMDDQELTALYNRSLHADMPNMLADADDDTQKFVYTAGLNAKPQVLDDADFDQYMKDNNISQSEIMSRSIDPITYRNNSNTKVRLSADQISRMLKDSSLNYIGGKHGGNVHGSGTYFDMNGGAKTFYGNTATINAVLSKNAKVIKEADLYYQADDFVKSHPQFENAIGPITPQNQSIYALAMGYNTIKALGQSYYNVIDRSALVIRKNDR